MQARNHIKARILADAVQVIGANFLPARRANWDDVERVIDSFDGGYDSGVLYHSDELDVYRIIKAMSVGKMQEYRVLFVAERIEDGVLMDDYILTHGRIRTSSSEKVRDYEKVGKRLLYRATRELWGAEY